MLKKVRIDADGKIVYSDRSINTTKNPNHGGPDNVQWIRTPGNGRMFTIRFKKSPFQGGSQDIDVPGGGAHEVSQARGRYKYEVRDSSGAVTDDPDVIID